MSYMKTIHIVVDWGDSHRIYKNRMDPLEGKSNWGQHNHKCLVADKNIIP